MTDVSYRLASITAIGSEGVSVQFEGEDTASDKSYTVMQDYHPTLNDRVVMLNISGTYIVLGSVGTPTAPVEYIPLTQKGAAGGVATLNSAGQVSQKAVSAAMADAATTASTSNSADSATTATTATNFTSRHTGSSLGFYGHSAVSRQGISLLSASADLPTTVSRVNSIISMLQNNGMCSN